ncbi:hypothetical protein COCVIDRAFT_92826, partial [Bipolaris victoriae FI3]
SPDNAPGSVDTDACTCCLFFISQRRPRLALCKGKGGCPCRIGPRRTSKPFPHNPLLAIFSSSPCAPQSSAPPLCLASEQIVGTFALRRTGCPELDDVHGLGKKALYVNRNHAASLLHMHHCLHFIPPRPEHRYTTLILHSHPGSAILI